MSRFQTLVVFLVVATVASFAQGQPRPRIEIGPAPHNNNEDEPSVPKFDLAPEFDLDDFDLDEESEHADPEERRPFGLPGRTGRRALQALRENLLGIGRLIGFSDYQALPTFNAAPPQAPAPLVAPPAEAQPQLRQRGMIDVIIADDLNHRTITVRIDRNATVADLKRRLVSLDSTFNDTHVLRLEMEVLEDLRTLASYHLENEGSIDAANKTQCVTYKGAKIFVGGKVIFKVGGYLSHRFTMGTVKSILAADWTIEIAHGTSQSTWMTIREWLWADLAPEVDAFDNIRAGTLVLLPRPDPDGTNVIEATLTHVFANGRIGHASYAYTYEQVLHIGIISLGFIPLHN